MQHNHRLKRKRYRLGFSSLGLTLMLACLSLAGIFWVSASSLEGRGDAAVMPVSQRAVQTKRIEDIQVGDCVLAKDPGDPGTPTPHKVIALPRNWTEHVVHVRIEGGGELQATRMHPFWVQGKGWTNAVDLKNGDKLVDDQGKTQLVASAVVEDKTAGTYNLTVEGVHTYYVLAGDEPILVHNVRLVDGRPWAPMPSGGPPVPVPGAPEMPWEQTGPQRNGVPSYKPAAPVTSDSGSQPRASWDERGHWDIDNGDGTRSRYDYRGNSLTTDQAHDPTRPSTPSCP